MRNNWGGDRVSYLDDYFDLHIYPINGNCLPNLITYTDMAAQAGKQTAISETWLLKESDAEFQNPPKGSNSGGETFYARDPFSFDDPDDVVMRVGHEHGLRFRP